MKNSNLVRKKKAREKQQLQWQQQQRYSCTTSRRRRRCNATYCCCLPLKTLIKKNVCSKVKLQNSCKQQQLTPTSITTTFKTAIKRNIEESNKATTIAMINKQQVFLVKSPFNKFKLNLNALILAATIICCSPFAVINISTATQTATTTLPTTTIATTTTTTSGHFPGVSSSVESAFCVNDLPPKFNVDLALMVVHVKRAVSFNYKVYLISGDKIVQTGQIVPRDDFRIHAFPVRAKSLREFVGKHLNSSSFVDLSLFLAASKHTNKSLFKSTTTAQNSVNKLNKGNKEEEIERSAEALPTQSSSSLARARTRRGKANDDDALPDDARGAPLPGDFELNVNAAIQFDDTPTDESMNKRKPRATETQAQLMTSSTQQQNSNHQPINANSNFQQDNNNSNNNNNNNNNIDDSDSRPVIPVGAFSSFQVNVSYLVRKDFDDLMPLVMRLEIDAKKFEVSSLEIVNVDDDAHWQACDFLTHKLLRHKDTRIVSVTQIYEDWIGKGFNTFVYIQRKLYSSNSNSNSNSNTSNVNNGSNFSSSFSGVEALAATATQTQRQQQQQLRAIVNERLVFVGSSSQLVGVDSMAQTIRATTFVTELKGLHYFLEFVDNAKFRLSAVSWSQKPYVVFDGQRFSLKPLRTLHDNQELLLCPPAICRSNQPIDELFVHGFQNSSLRLVLRDWHWHLKRQATTSNSNNKSGFTLDFTTAVRNDLKPAIDSYGFALIGSEVDATFRIGEHLYAISSNQLLKLSFEQRNKTVISKALLSDEFVGLTSTLLEPITGALFDSQRNKIYFFKGEQFTAFDFKTRKPSLLLQQQQQQQSSNSLIATATSTTGNQKQKLEFAPNLLFFGVHVYVDAIFRDDSSDTLFVFSKDKFFSLPLSSLSENGFVDKQQQSATAAATSTNSRISFSCINKKFLVGVCQFDRVTNVNPCIDDGDEDDASIDSSSTTTTTTTTTSAPLLLNVTDTPTTTTATTTGTDATTATTAIVTPSSIDTNPTTTPTAPLSSPQDDSTLPTTTTTATITTITADTTTAKLTTGKSEIEREGVDTTPPTGDISDPPTGTATNAQGSDETTTISAQPKMTTTTTSTLDLLSEQTTTAPINERIDDKKVGDLKVENPNLNINSNNNIDDNDSSSSQPTKSSASTTATDNDNNILTRFLRDSLNLRSSSDKERAIVFALLAMFSVLLVASCALIVVCCARVLCSNSSNGNKCCSSRSKRRRHAVDLLEPLEVIQKARLDGTLNSSSTKRALRNSTKSAQFRNNTLIKSNVAHLHTNNNSSNTASVTSVTPTTTTSTATATATATSSARKARISNDFTLNI